MPDPTEITPEDLPEDPREQSLTGDAWTGVNAPDGRIGSVSEVKAVVANASGMVLLKVDEKKEWELAADDYIVWIDGEWQGVLRDDFDREGWTLILPSSLLDDVT